MSLRAFTRALARFVGQIVSDAMLALCLVAPIMAGAAFRFGLPLAERFVAGYFGEPALVSRFYPLSDLFLGFLSGYMVAFAAAMVILEERDDGTAAYLAVTPLGRGGYLLSRLVAPLVFTIPLALAVLSVFGLSGFSAPLILAVSLAAVPVSAGVALFVVSFSGNRVEGLALGKLAGIMLVSLAAPFFASGPWAYAAGVFPSYWIAAFALDGEWTRLVGFTLCAAAWLAPLWSKFSRLRL